MPKSKQDFQSLSKKHFYEVIPGLPHLTEVPWAPHLTCWLSAWISTFSHFWSLAWRTAFWSVFSSPHLHARKRTSSTGCRNVAHITWRSSVVLYVCNGTLLTGCKNWHFRNLSSISTSHQRQQFFQPGSRDKTESQATACNLPCWFPHWLSEEDGRKDC